MPTYLSLDDHLAAIQSGGTVMRDAAAQAGLNAPVPTCPEWSVAQLVVHQSMVHRWAVANLRGDEDHSPEDSEAEGQAAPDLLAWFSDGVDSLIDTVRATPDDAEAMVFLKDAPPPKRFWARRQAHEMTIHSVDALSAALGRWPSASDVSVKPELAADGIDELLCGFIPRRKTRLRSPEPYTIAVTTADTEHAWSLQVSEDPVVTVPGQAESADAAFSGSAVQVYLSLWNRADEMVTTGRADVLAHWRAAVQVRWG